MVCQSCLIKFKAKLLIDNNNTLCTGRSKRLCLTQMQTMNISYSDTTNFRNGSIYPFNMGVNPGKKANSIVYIITEYA